MSRKVTILRDRWTRGSLQYDGKGPSTLLNGLGCQCCVGHYLTACGVPNEVIRGKGPADERNVLPHLPEEAKWLVQEPDELQNRRRSDDAQKLYTLNDDTGVTAGNEKLREERIAAVFAKHDVEVVFVDELPDAP